MVLQFNLLEDFIQFYFVTHLLEKGTDLRHIQSLPFSSLGKKILFTFSFAGKMAFTNYILQSIIGYFLMRSISLYETLTPTTAILITIIVFIAQVFLSKFWLSRFKLGPLEWLWRCISYGKILPIKIKAYNTVYSK
jgi:uncharacterized membrane protein YeiB